MKIKYVKKYFVEITFKNKIMYAAPNANDDSWICQKDKYYFNKSEAEFASMLLFKVQSTTSKNENVLCVDLKTEEVINNE